MIRPTAYMSGRLRQLQRCFQASLSVNLLRLWHPRFPKRTSLECLAHAFFTTMNAPPKAEEIGASELSVDSKLVQLFYGAPKECGERLFVSRRLWVSGSQRGSQ